MGEIIQRLIPRAAVLTNDMVVDRRNYYVRFMKIRETLGFLPIHTLEESIMEMKEALECGAVMDYRNRYHNNHHYLEPDCPRCRAGAGPCRDRRAGGD